MNKGLIFICTACYIFGLLTHYYFSVAKNSHQIVSAEKQAEHSKEIAQLSKKINQLNKHIYILKETIAESSQHEMFNKTAEVLTQATDKSTNEIIKLTNKVNELALYKKISQRKSALRWSNELHQLGNEQLLKKLNNDFNQENRDLSWASQQEKRIAQLFSDDETLAAFSVDKADCKSEQCRISLYSSDSDQIAKISESLLNRLYNSDTQHYGSFVTLTDQANNVTQVYIGRNSDSLIYSPKSK